MNAEQMREAAARLVSKTAKHAFDTAAQFPEQSEQARVANQAGGYAEALARDILAIPISPARNWEELVPMVCYMCDANPDSEFYDLSFEQQETVVRVVLSALKAAGALR